MSRWTPPAYVSLSWSDLQAAQQRRNRLRFWAGLAAGAVLVVVVPLVVMLAVAGL